MELDHSTGYKLSRGRKRTPEQKEKQKETRRERRQAPYAIPQVQQDEIQPPAADQVVIPHEPVEPIVGQLEAGINDRRLLTRDGEPALFVRPITFHPSVNDRQVEPAPDQVDPDEIPLDLGESDLE